jgi:ketosteroid isomerase-like protein
MKKKHLKSALMLLVSTIFCFQLFAQKDIDKLKSEIESINAKLVKANIAGDLETIASFYTDDIIHMPNYAPMVKGKEIMIEKEKETKEAGFKMLSMNLIIIDVFPAKDMVIDNGMGKAKRRLPEDQDRNLEYGCQSDENEKRNDGEEESEKD